MESYHDIQFPGESAEYREKRNQLLEAEIKLRNQLESTARLRRTLPKGGALKENYNFEELTNTNSGETTIQKVRFTDLFQDDKDSLFIYNFMYASADTNPCTYCTSLLDGLNGIGAHVRDRLNFVVIAKSPVEKLATWAEKRGWNNLRLLSSGNNSFNRDYHAESSDGAQWPAAHVFHRDSEGNIYHFYSTEMLYSPSEERQHTRHVDMIWPLWNVFDMTPEGRGANWHPRLFYEE